MTSELDPIRLDPESIDAESHYQTKDNTSRDAPLP